MADSSVPITAGSGTNVDSRTNAAGEHRQVVVLGNDGEYVSGVEPWGALRVSAQWTTLFYDDWGTSPLDTTDKWTTTGTTPTVAAGLMTMPATVSTYNAIRSKDTIRPNLGHTLVRNGITIETTAAVGAGRFWGLGTTATTPAPAVLAQDGVGFEIDQATGGLLAVTYAAGVRTTVATLTAGATPTGTGAVTTSTVPTIRDGINHRYGVYFRVTDAWWFIDSTPVAYVSFPTNQVAALPALIVRQNAASFTGTPTFTNIAFLTADSSGQGQSISDPVIGSRMARVTASGELTISDPDTTAAGTLTAAAQSVAISTNGQAVTGIQVTGTWAATLVFEATTDGTNWFTVNGVASVTGAQVGSATANGQWRVNSAGYSQVRVRCSAFTSGTAAVSLIANSSSSLVTLAEPLPTGTNTIGNVGVAFVARTTGTASGNIFVARSAITTATTSVLQAAPAAGLSLYITDVSVSNAGATLCTVSLLPSAGTSVLDIVAAATGGGGSMNFQTPIKLAAATGLSVTTSAASTTVFVTVTGYTSA